MNPLDPEIPDQLPPDTERDRQVELLIREYLGTEAKQADAETMVLKVRGKLAIVPPPQPKTTRRSWLRWAGIASGGAVAAGLGYTILNHKSSPLTSAREVTAAELVRETKIIHETSIDEFRYDVEANWELTPFVRFFPFRPISRTAKLWIRKNAFFMEMTFEDLPGQIRNRFVKSDVPQQWAWGQDPSGQVWIVPNRKRVLLYNKEELAEPLARFCDLMSLRATNTLAELLESSDLSRVDPSRPDVIVINAVVRPKPSQPLGPRIVKAEFEIDSKSKIIRKAVIHRQVLNELIGKFVFTLHPTKNRESDERYSHTGHIDTDAEVIHGPDRPAQPPFDPNLDPRVRFREEWLKRWKDQPQPPAKTN